MSILIDHKHNEYHRDTPPVVLMKLKGGYDAMAYQMTYKIFFSRLINGGYTYIDTSDEIQIFDHSKHWVATIGKTEKNHIQTSQYTTNRLFRDITKLAKSYLIGNFLPKL